MSPRVPRRHIIDSYCWRIRESPTYEMQWRVRMLFSIFRSICAAFCTHPEGGSHTHCPLSLLHARKLAQVPYTGKRCSCMLSLRGTHRPLPASIKFSHSVLVRFGPLLLFSLREGTFVALLRSKKVRSGEVKVSGFLFVCRLHCHRNWTATGLAHDETQGREVSVSQDCGLNSPRNFAPWFGPVF